MRGHCHTGLARNCGVLKKIKVVVEGLMTTQNIFFFFTFVYTNTVARNVEGASVNDFLHQTTEN